MLKFALGMAAISLQNQRTRTQVFPVGLNEMETGIIMAYIWVILGLDWDNGKQNGNYYNIIMYILGFPEP